MTMSLAHPDLLKILVYSVVGFFSAWALIAFILFDRTALSRSQASRSKDFHHAQKTGMPRLGGVALAVSFVIISLVIAFNEALSPGNARTLLVIVLSSLAMFALGFWDDLRPLRAHWKLAAQIAVACAVYFSNIRIEIFKNPVTETELALGVFSFFATVLWLVTLTNLINLIDGIDGLAGGIGLMLMVLLANLGGGSGFTLFLAVGVAGALLGFLRFNYPPAKIYMGDGGAYFLGFLIGVLSIVNSNKGTILAALVAPAFALALPLVDVSLAVIRRGLPGLPLFRPDRKHIHHQLITLGFSRERALLALYAVSLACLILAFSVFYWQGRMLPLFTGLLFLVLLVSGHLLGVSSDWFTIGSRLGKSLALRKETRYALTLSRWLEMEVERLHSVEELWQDYQFVVSKLGFSRVKLVLPDGAHTWESDEFEQNSAEMKHSRHEINNGTVIEFDADRRVMSDMLFNLLGDLAAEIWYKAASRWRALNKAPLESTSPARRARTSPPKKKVRYPATIRPEPRERDIEFT